MADVDDEDMQVQDLLLKCFGPVRNANRCFLFMFQPDDPEASTLQMLVEKMRKRGIDMDSLLQGHQKTVICYDFLSWIQKNEDIEVHDWSASALDM